MNFIQMKLCGSCGARMVWTNTERERLSDKKTKYEDGDLNEK